MILYVELWKAKPAWLAPSQADRSAYLDKVGSSVQGLLEAGVVNIGWASSDTDTPFDSGHQYSAVWTMPSRDQVAMLEQGIEQAGWHDYFDQ